MIILFFALFLCFCGRSDKQNKIRKIIKQRSGQAIIIPENIYVAPIYDSTLLSENPTDYNYTLINYTEGDCGECIAELYKWQGFINNNKEMFKNSRMIFIIYSENYFQFEFIIEDVGIALPFYYDSLNQYIAINEINENFLKTLLLNKNEQIILIGSPIENPAMEELYRKTINRTPP